MKQLTRNTKLKLIQIKDLPAWHQQLVQDKHSAGIGEVRQWADGNFHTKTTHGWRIATQQELDRAKTPIKTYNREANHARRARTQLSKKTAHLNSSEFAKTLKISDWGNPDQVETIAKPIREVSSWEEAETVLEKLNGQTLRNKDGLAADVSKSKIGKFTSGKASKKSLNLKAHYMAVANLDLLFKNSKEFRDPEPPKGKNGNPPSADIRWFHKLYAPMKFEGRIIPVKITVREYTSPKNPNKAYSVESIEAEL